MARIRTIKPQFFLNEQLAELGYAERLLFIGLWTQADKAGRLEDRPLRLKAALFPYDDFNVTDALGRLVNAGLITKYDGNGVPLIAINTWTKHQRPHSTEVESELPPPRLNNGSVTVTEPVEGNGKEGSGKEGNGIALSRATLLDRFEQFWAVYPRKVGRGACITIWERLKPSDEMTAHMIAAVNEQAKSSQWRKEGGQYIPHPRTWLNQGRWQDRPDQHRPNTGLQGLEEAIRG